MAAISEIIGIAREVAGRTFRPVEVVQVEAEPGIGSDGEPILRVTVVLPDQQFDAVDGEHFLDAVVEVNQELQRLGDDRFAVLSYMTESDWQHLDDPEP